MLEPPSCCSIRARLSAPDNAEIIVGDGASLILVSVQDWEDDAVHLAHLHARIGRDASYRQALVSIGGDMVRISSSVDFAAPGGEAELLGLYFADAGQHLEHRLFVDHNAPRTRSNVDYRGALQGQGAHTVWIGDVLIRKVAEGIKTYESNKNLVLTDGCRADSVPNLEIETGEIEGAGHASTTGRFDDEQLFYLRSRGIEEAEARRLVVHGFFADIIRQGRRTGDREAAARGRRGGTGDQHRTSVVSTLVRVCSVDDVPPESAIPVEVPRERQPGRAGHRP